MELRGYLEVIRSRIWLMLSLALAVAVSAAGLSALREPAYEGVATVLVTQQNAGLTILGTSQGPASYQPERDLSTQVRVIESVPVVQHAIEALDLDVTASELLAQVTVVADTAANVIDIRVTDATPEGAARKANALAESYAAWSRETQQRSIAAAADDVSQRLEEAQRQIVDLESRAAAPDATGADQVRLEAAQSLYATLLSNLEELRISEQLVTGVGSVLATATPNPNPVSPQPGRDATLGLAIGLFVGLAGVFFAEQLDTRIKSEEEAGAVWTAPLLASIPLETKRRADRRQLTVTKRPDSATAEAYRMLRNNLGFINTDQSIKVLLITSAVAREGKSTVAANLAAVLSQAGGRVVLVDCDFRVRAVERFFELASPTGLSDVLAGEAKLEDVLHKAKGLDKLLVLAAGSLPASPSEVLGSEAMARLTSQLRRYADWVIFDSAPVLVAADSAAVARWVDGVLVVTRLGVSKRESARAGREQLHGVGARILGVAACGSRDRARLHAYYGYRTPGHDPS